MTPDVGEYKAVICVFLFGGNPGFNTVVPRTLSKYNEYAAARAANALPLASLLALNGTASDGNLYGLHPSLPKMRTRFNDGNAAIICNVGTLVQPTTKTQAVNGSVPLPSQRFSHIDQQIQWMTSIAGDPARYGWAGRTYDLYTGAGYNPLIPANINVTAAAAFQDGRSTNQYNVGTAGAPTMDVTVDTSYRSGARRTASLALHTQAQTDGNVLVATHSGIRQSAEDKVGVLGAALAAAGETTITFPLGQVSNQLHMVARLIKARTQLGDARQIFFVSQGSYDFHDNELNGHATLLTELDNGLDLLWQELQAQGILDRVTIFTNSDFGRSLVPNNDGSDHAWGSHAFVLGTKVNGGYYGTMPSLVVGGADDCGQGRIVPTTSTDQYAATLAEWFGVNPADLNTLFPNVHNFTPKNLGFMKPYFSDTGNFAYQSFASGKYLVRNVYFNSGASGAGAVTPTAETQSYWGITSNHSQGAGDVKGYWCVTRGWGNDGGIYGTGQAHVNWQAESGLGLRCNGELTRAKFRWAVTVPRTRTNGRFNGLVDVYFHTTANPSSATAIHTDLMINTHMLDNGYYQAVIAGITDDATHANGHGHKNVTIGGKQWAYIIQDGVFAPNNVQFWLLPVNVNAMGQVDATVDLKAIIDYCIANGLMPATDYLTSINAGFEVIADETGGSSHHTDVFWTAVQSEPDGI